MNLMRDPKTKRLLLPCCGIVFNLSWRIVFLNGFGRIESFNQRFNTLLCHSTKQKIRFIRFMSHYFNDTWVLFEFVNEFFQ